MTIQEILEDIRAAQRKMQQHGEAALKDAFKTFFNECPAVQEVAWSQYAPYFNDGDACVFSVNTPCFHAQIVDTDADDYCQWEHFSEDGPCVYKVLSPYHRGGHYDREKRAFVGGTPLSSADQSTFDACSSLSSVFELEDLFEQVFGNHVSVRATRDGFDVAEYDHD